MANEGEMIALHPIGVIHSPYRESKDIPIHKGFPVTIAGMEYPLFIL